LTVRFYANRLTIANNLAMRKYPYLITTDWVYGYRAKRIVEMISQQTEPITLEDVQQIQGDDRNLNAQTLVPLLQQLIPPACKQPKNFYEIGICS